MPRKLTGLIRPFPIPTGYDALEYEYIGRKAKALKMKKAQYTRSKTLPPGWRQELLKLREAQKNLPNDEFRRKPDGTPAEVAG